MDNLGIMLDDTVSDVLLHANELSQRSGAQSITDVIAFVQLAKEEKTCFHSFLFVAFKCYTDCKWYST